MEGGEAENGFSLHYRLTGDHSYGHTARLIPKSPSFFDHICCLRTQRYLMDSSLARRQIRVL
jgi:hypothetical protein